MRKSRRGGLRPALMLASISLFLCTSPHLAAQEQPAPGGATDSRDDGIVPAAYRRTLGLGLFFPLPGQELEKLIPENTSLDTLAALALEAGEGSMSATLPGLLASRLEPLAPYPGENQGSGESFWKRAEVAAKNKDEGFFDPRSDREAILALGGFAAGLYAQTPKGLEILLLYYEKGSPLPKFFHRHALGIAELEKLHEFFLPRLLSWVFGRSLSVYDIQTGVSGTLGVERRAGGSSSFFHQGSRIFLTETGPQVFSLSADGYEGRDIEIDNPGPFAYRLIQAPLKRLVESNPALEFNESTKVLEWENEEAFRKARGRFGAALGRFLLSLPLSVVSVGTFISAQEAYLRYAKPASAYYGAGAFAGLSVGLSLGFTIDTIVALVDLLRLSR